TVRKLCNLDKLEYTEEKPEDAVSIIMETTELYVPIAQSIDLEQEIANLEEDLKYQKGFLKTVEIKLSNEKFVNNAPDKVVNMERKKQADALARIKVIEQQLQNLKK
ncbi:MAG: valine--tRNA ligase, partial [Bacteroidales bacterium]